MFTVIFQLTRFQQLWLKEKLKLPTQMMDYTLIIWPLILLPLPN